jgi:hypothetical protein
MSTFEMPSSLLGEDDADMDFDLLFDEDTGRGEGDQSWHDDTCMHMNLRVMRRLLATNTDAFDRKVRVLGWRQHMPQLRGGDATGRVVSDWD